MKRRRGYGAQQDRLGENNRIPCKYNGDLPCLAVDLWQLTMRRERGRFYLRRNSTVCPSHYREQFRRYIKLISPSTIWTKVLSFTPFLLPFFHYTSQTRSLQCLCGSLLSRVLAPTDTNCQRVYVSESHSPIEKKKTRTSPRSVFIQALFLTDPVELSAVLSQLIIESRDPRGLLVKRDPPPHPQ